MQHFTKHSDQSSQFNMTPVIDIVFLLIVFFMLVCSFIAAENFDVTVPDEIDSAQNPAAETEQITTLTVMKDAYQNIKYAVGAETIETSSPDHDIATLLATALDKKLSSLSPAQRTVSLRIDKSITYEHSRHAIAAISKSTATDIKIAAIRN